MSEIHSPAIVEHAAGRILLFDSATFVEAYVAANPCRDDVVVASSYAGVLCAKMIVAARSRAVIGLDCNIGKDGAGIAGLWYYEALGIPAAAADVMTAEMCRELQVHGRRPHPHPSPRGRGDITPSPVGRTVARGGLRPCGTARNVMPTIQ